MSLTDANGDPIPEEDPRLPTPEEIETHRARAEQLRAHLVTITGTDPAPLVDAVARIETLAELLVPASGAARLLYEHGVQRRRRHSFASMVQDLQEKAAPKLVIAETDVRGLGLDKLR